MRTDLAFFQVSLNLAELDRHTILAIWEYALELANTELRYQKGLLGKQIGGALAGWNMMKLCTEATRCLDLTYLGTWVTDRAIPQKDTHSKEEDQIQIFIKTLDGKTICWRIWKGRKIQELKNKIENHLGIPAYRQNLICLGHSLQDNLTLQDYGITADSTIIINLRLRGGSTRTSSKST